MLDKLISPCSAFDFIYLNDIPRKKNFSAHPFYIFNSSLQVPDPMFSLFYWPEEFFLLHEPVPAQVVWHYRNRRDSRQPSFGAASATIDNIGDFIVKCISSNYKRYLLPSREVICSSVTQLPVCSVLSLHNRNNIFLCGPYQNRFGKGISPLPLPILKWASATASWLYLI